MRAATPAEPAAAMRRSQGSSTGAPLPSSFPSFPTLLHTHKRAHTQVWLRFPREGSEVTPPHPSNDFKWKDYCTTAFK